MEETGLDKKNARRLRAGIGRWSMLVSLLTRKMYELRLRQAFGLLIQEISYRCATVSDLHRLSLYLSNIRVQTGLRLRICRCA